MPVRVLKLAVCLFDDVAALDFIGPMELFHFLYPGNRVNKSDVALDATFFSPTTDPVRTMAGPLLLPTRTYDSVGSDEQFDMLLVPGGSGSSSHATPKSLLEFVTRQAPGAEYVLSVCTGSWILARAGILDGKRATSSKYSFNEIRDNTKDRNITWVTKARWVVDGKYWTSSGITAGIDMAAAFLVHLVGNAQTDKIRGIVEVSVRGQDEDEFADVFGLV